jgi:hypothetical protein
MSEMIARCGFKCHLCPAFDENIKSPDDQVRGAAGWSKYFGIEVRPEKLRCLGCMSSDRDGLDFPDKRCPIRPCASAKGLDNCARCEDYICRNLASLFASVEGVAKRFQGQIPQADYDAFIAPYDSRKTLDTIRQELGLPAGRLPST